MKIPSSIGLIGGKGGVGTTTIAIQLSFEYARLGVKPLLVDADPSMGDIHDFLDLEEQGNISECFDGEVVLNDILKNGPHGLKILTTIQNGAIADNDLDILKFVNKFTDMNSKTLQKELDVVVLDLGNKVIYQHRPLMQSVENIVLVTAPNRESIINTYRSIKFIHIEHGVKKFGLIINQAQYSSEGDEVHHTIEIVTKKYLEIELTLIGSIPYDTALLMGCKPSQPSLKLFPFCAVPVSMSQIINKINKMATIS